MKTILRAGAVSAAWGLSLAVLPPGSADAAPGGTRVRCNDVTALKNAIDRANSSGPNSPEGRITLASHCTYTLTALDHGEEGLPAITGNVTISGRDTTTAAPRTPRSDFASSWWTRAGTSLSIP